MKKLLLSALVLLCFSVGASAQKKPAKTTKAPQSRTSAATTERTKIKMEEEKTGMKSSTTVASSLKAETIEVDQPKTKAVSKKN